MLPIEGGCLAHRWWVEPRKAPFPGLLIAQGRQDSNLEPPVLETGALPVELRPSARRHCIGVRRKPLGALFAVLAIGFILVGLYAADAGGAAWVIAAAAVFIGVWMGELAYKQLR